MHVWHCMYILHHRIYYNALLYLSDQPLRPVMQDVKPSDTTLSLAWMHNNVCFKDCIVYNISWSPPFTSSIVNGTNYTIDGLQPGQTYSVRVCAVCEGHLPNCTQNQSYTTGEMHADTHTVYTVPIYLRTQCSYKLCTIVQSSTSL